MKEHHYKTTITWTGNTGSGTSDYRSYERAHTISIEGKQDIAGSSDPAFRGDKSRYNPEELLLSSVAVCHMLWYLHLCSVAGVVVIAYEDKAEATMAETGNGGGYFTQVILKPLITLKDAAMQAKADELHHEANKLCFIANSVKFPVLHQAEYKVEG
jgi:organic hydroperoxide reductase OsmC/OhrA